ncbi:MAG: TatD family hydrolase [Burkholderiales bacterium]|nr:TatD family hydrolase [Burkholderiales bacterium]
MWIDSHCHLDAAEFNGEQALLVQQAQQAEVAHIILPAVERANFATVANLAQQFSCCSYTLGIHPIFVPQADDDDLDYLRQQVQSALQDPGFVGIGEIGLDFFIPMLCTPDMRAKQERFFAEQLKIAREFDLPVLMHVRRSQDIILKYLRRLPVPSGIAHAFNGSVQQAQQFIAANCKLGLGGAMTFTRALQIRRLAQEFPLSALVLETDAPDISPAWLHPQRNEPAQVARIGVVLAELRGIDVASVAQATSENVAQALPRLNLQRGLRTSA